MKKIFISLGIIGAVAAVAVGATTAFFSDTETSTGNTFTAGKIDLKIDSFGAWRNDVEQQNTSWAARDLTSEKFFDFADVKPGDWFTRSVSIHVSNNPAWICLLPLNKQENENMLTDPEVEAHDTTSGTPVGGVGEGELGKNMSVAVWHDINPDGMHQPDEPFIHQSGPWGGPLADSFFDVFTEIALHDSTTGNGALDTIPTEMIAMTLCGGTTTVNPGTGALSCDGSHMDNQSQTDSLTADLRLYAVQERNNPDFKCSDLANQ